MPSKQIRFAISALTILMLTAIACTTSVPASSSTQTPASEPPPKLDNQGFSTVDVVRMLTPSVVQITTQTLSMGLFNQPIPGTGVGTGIILDTEGHILTNNHVIANAQAIKVITNDGKSLSAELIGGDLQTDLAIIQIDASDLQPVTLGDSDKLQVGEDVIAIGQALGLSGGPTVTKGVISALGRSIDTDPNTTIVDLIQTDAEINPGNSGGPLVNAHAEVVGINTAMIQTGRGIGFAINVNDAKAVMEQLIEKGFVERGFLGVSPVNVTPSIAAQLNLPIEEGLLVARVIPGTAAAEAGLRENDVIEKLDGLKMTNTGELSKFLMEHPPGDTMEITYIRRGTRITTEVTLGERPR